MKQRNIGNLATRNAIQGDRAAVDSRLQQVCNEMEMTHRRQLEALQLSLNESEARRRSLEITVTELNMSLESQTVADRRRLDGQLQAVNEALREQREAFDDQLRQQQIELREETKRVRQDALTQIDAIHMNHKLQVEALQQNERETRSIFAAERGRLENDCTKLREQLLQAAAEVSREREHAEHRIREEKDRLQKLQEEAAGELLRIKADMQQQVARILLDAKAESSRKESELEIRMTKWKESSVAAHAIELARLDDSHSAEIKRVMAELDVRHHDNLVKVQHLHEQEVNRLLRETERLRKIIIRNGGASYFNADCPTDIGARREGTPTPTSTYSARSKSASRASIREKINRSRSRTPTLKEETHTHLLKEVVQLQPPLAATPSSGLNWAAVRQSMQNEQQIISNKEDSRISQESTGVVNLFALAASPPSSFPLDESVESRNSSFVTMGTRITSNADRVGNYMHKLEEYLLGNNDAV